MAGGGDTSEIEMPSSLPLMPLNGTGDADPHDPHDPRYQQASPLRTQLPLALILGVGAFVVFCMLRTKWNGVYGIRGRAKRSANVRVPELTGSFFGWVRELWLIPDSVLLENAGLDAYVFLEFFKMAVRFCTVAGFLGVAIIMPINKHFTNDAWGGISSDASALLETSSSWSKRLSKILPREGESYLYSYIVFLYVFTGLFLWQLFRTTRDIVRVRQEYLANENSVTSRTVQLYVIPKPYRNEEALRQLFDSVNIGKIAKVMVCRDFEHLDELFAERKEVLFKLELALTRYYHRNILRDLVATVDSAGSYRPQLRQGLWGLFGPKIDAIDYYTAKLHNIDMFIEEARDATPRTSGMAFITFESSQSAQIASQVLLQSEPHKFRCRLAPAALDINWSHTYLSSNRRIFQGYAVTILSGVVTFLWAVPVSVVAAVFNRDNIRNQAPKFDKWLERFPLIGDLFQGFVPTLIYTIFISLTPFIFDSLSAFQGRISRGDEELDSVSKNYFFNSVNYFLVFVAADTLTAVQNIAKDTTQIPYLLAKVLRSQSQFYVDLIVLQGIGILPFRLLEFGNLLAYPWMKMRAKTPRQKKDLQKPPYFNFAFFLPQPLLVYSICLFYSIVAPIILIFGLVYFAMGFVVYKYQLLFALEHPYHSTGKVWVLIYNRAILGIVVFHAAMAGFFLARHAAALAACIIPLTVWLLVESRSVNKKAYFRYLSLLDINSPPHGRQRRSSTTMEEVRERGAQYIHPHLSVSLEGPYGFDAELSADHVIEGP